jgi:hypothetical protein
MSALRDYSDVVAGHQTGSAPAVNDTTGRQTGPGGGSSRGNPQNSVPSATKIAISILLAAWLAAVIVLGASRAFVSPVGMPPYPIAIAVTAPLVLFFTALWLSGTFRRFVSNVDIRLVTMIQAWRWAGFGFISLYAYGVLPGRFAWPAGLGDMAIGFTAPWIALALVRRPSFAGSRLFVIWNLLGILDLVLAVTNAALFQTQATGAAGEITVAPMALLPLLLIPAYLVPLFIMLHVTNLIQARQAARTM